ncbi:sigma-70 family RNA polymerase sigma factor [Leptolyngbya sp. 7M]|uniref:sigma-70 family RNA polymerase sigma factor n=1 Tax=Leptolyngbya sp. 7M TaxID=2812896 RepID=UPI001B8C526C|nr:sigma-70 family RNA polymerase sigma factor [Leptolyngbya sp. 7M]QYO64289.1 sigma-70 family RNA polymerase sigma factor [Leptolyngbya sp. 7M]
MNPDSSALRSTAASISSESSDLELLTALATGQVHALGILYDRYAKLVYSLAFKILENSEEAEDVTQDVFLTLWRRNTYNPSRGSLSSFLTMTRSRAIDKLRSKGARLRVIQRLQGIVRTEPSSTTPLEQASVGERAQLIRDALAQLSETERQVLEIAYYEGLSQSEIAKRLNIPLGTVKTRSRQGLLKLRQTLQDYI